MNLFKRQLPVLIIIAVFFPVTLFIKDNFLWLDTSVITSVYTLLALSVGVSYGLAGILTVAQASFAAIGAYATAILTIRYGVSPYLSLLLSVMLPAAVAYPVGRVVNRLNPLALAIATLFFGQIVDLAIRNGGDFTGNYIGLSGIPSLTFLSSVFAQHVAGWVIVCIVVFIYSNFVDSAWGRAMATLRYDSLRATADGVDVPRMRSIALAVSAAIAGLSGWLYAHHSTYLSPDSLGTSQSLSALLMAVIGGAQYVLGPVVGAVVLTLVLQFLPGQEVVGMFYGGVLILILVAMPGGILGAVEALVRRSTRATGRRSPTQSRETVHAAAKPPVPFDSGGSLVCEDLVARYGRIAVCHDVKFSINSGERVALLGPNGAGKSTLLGAIAGIVTSSGKIAVAGHDINGSSPNRRAWEGVGFVPEIRGNIFPTLSVVENIRSGLRLIGAADQSAALEKTFSLFPILQQRSRTAARMLSGGEQQMLAIAMAAARRPAVLLLDEPSQGLAPSIHHLLRDTFEKLSAEGIAMLIAEQNIPFAASFANRCLLLRGGRLVLAGGPELLRDPDRLAALFLGTDQEMHIEPERNRDISGSVHSVVLG